MNRNRWLAVLVIGLALIAYFARPRIIDGPRIRGHTVEGFLSDTGDMVRFDRKLVVGICQLEDTTQGLDSIKRLCPTGDPKDVFIPTYPSK